MTDLRLLTVELLLTGCAIGLAGCAVATVVGSAWDVGKTVVKIPFMLGKGVYDVMTEEPVARPVVELPALAPTQVVESPARAVAPVAIPFPVSPPDLPEVSN
jgi:hypothetical protein